jgi:fructose-1,6-bisphosphatase/inositol monophosphatase family enzyme
MGMKKSYKADKTVVTETDFAVNKLVIESINKRFPDHDILAEEESDMKRGSKMIWVCDPVDGTQVFSHGVPTCAFSLALVKDGKPILGIVADPFMDRICWAEKGSGAYLNGKKIKVSSQRTLDNALVSWCCWNAAQFKLSTLYPRIVSKNAYCVDLGSIAYQGMLVACGEFSASINPASMPHDTAALKVIIEEAGGQVTNLFGNEQRYDGPIKGVIMSNGFLHQELIGLIKESVLF